LLGRKVHYTRRKRAEECFNGEQFERQLFMHNCPCTEENYECDYGFERQGLDGPCVAIRAIKTETPSVCPPGGEYTISNGYRRVAGDSCDADAGVNHLPASVSCPSVFGSVTSNGWTVLVVVFLLGAGLFIVTYLSKDPDALDKIRSWIGDRKIRYHKLDVKPDTFSEDEFDLGVEMDEEGNDGLHDTNLHGFASDEPAPSSFGPLPMSQFEEATEIPTLQPPPSRSTVGYTSQALDFGQLADESN
jgi:hypothetical protein